LQRLLLKTLVRIYPRDFRIEHEEDLERFLEVQRAEGEYAGISGGLRYWWDVLADVLISGIRLRLGSLRGPVAGPMLQDLRHAFRSLRRSPGFTLVSVLTLGLGIGATTAIFSVVNGVLLEPLPFSAPDELVTFSLATKAVERGGFSVPAYHHFKSRNRIFQDMGGYFQSAQSLTLTGVGEPEQVRTTLVTASFWTTLGTEPVLGRVFTEAEDAPGAQPLAVLTHAFWVRRFGADPDVLGRSIELNGNVAEIVGVMPPAFTYPFPEADLWLSFRLDPASDAFGNHYVRAVGRLRPGTTVQAAIQNMESLFPSLSEVGYPANWLSDLFTGRIPIETLEDDIIGGAGRALFVVLGSVGLLLVIGCANVANLLLVRADARARETAVRRALGASSGQIARYLLAESTVMAGVGGALGITLAWVGTRGLIALSPPSIPRLSEVTVLSGPVLAFAAVVTLLIILTFGLAPTLRAGPEDLARTLREQGGGGTSTPGTRRLHSAMVVLQTALAVVLVVGAGLMLRSVRAVSNIDSGYSQDGILSFRVSLPQAWYPSSRERGDFYDQLLERIDRIPGVQATGATSYIPLTAKLSDFILVPLEGMELAASEFRPSFRLRWVSAGYFDVMGLMATNGRLFQPKDHADGANAVALVSSSIPDQYWPDRNPLGLKVGGRSVVGVVTETRDNGVTEPATAIIYIPMVDSLFGAKQAMDIVVRADGDPINLLPAIREQVRTVDPNLPIYQVRRMADVVAASTDRFSFAMKMLLIAAGTSLFLGAIGIYGVLAYVVNRRMPEIGLRMALGANRGSVQGMVLKHGTKLAGIGIVIGLVAATGLTRVMTTLLFGVEALDLPTFATGGAILLAVSTLACYLPSRRAAGADPVSAMRVD